MTKSDIDVSQSRLRLRAGAIADAERIEAVHWLSLEAAYLGFFEGWPEAPRDIGERVTRWREWLVAPDIDVIVGEVDGKIVGFCTLRAGADTDLDPLTEGEIPNLYVHPDHWSKGYGRRLCWDALRTARDRGFVSVCLWVVDINKRARDFYLEFGFTPDGGPKLQAHPVAPYTATRYRITLDLGGNPGG